MTCICSSTKIENSPNGIFGILTTQTLRHYAYKFNQPLNFDTSSVTNITDIDDMFNKCPISEENKPKLKIDN